MSSDCYVQVVVAYLLPTQDLCHNISVFNEGRGTSPEAKLCHKDKQAQALQPRDQLMVLN